jgi:mannose-6-phosphate isomerase-like protein (cupin superfamily)
MKIAPNVVLFALLSASGLQAQNPPAPAAITPRLDTPQVRVIVATLQPQTPSIARTGHATNRVLIYLDEGVMTRKEGEQTTKIEFHRGDVRWRPASGAYTAENVGNRPFRILEVDLKGPPAGTAPVTKLDPTVVDSVHYKVEFENEYVRVLRIHYGPNEKGQTHEHILNRVVLYLNDQTNAKADDVRMAGAATHAEENASAQPADRIAVELK